MNDKPATNNPMVLVEFTEADVKWMADHFHDVFVGITSVKAGLDPNGEAYAKLQEKQRMAAKIMNRVLDKAADQGFGDL